VALLCDRTSARIRDASQRQLPTDHDYDGGLSPIREYQSDQPSRNPPRQLTRVLQKPKSLGPPSFCTCGVVPYQEPIAHRPTEPGGAQPGRMQGAAKRRIPGVFKQAATRPRGRRWAWPDDSLRGRSGTLPGSHGLQTTWLRPPGAAEAMRNRLLIWNDPASTE
jgi:hypothetical protein